MADSVSQSEIALAATSLAKTLAPEDVCVGDYVAPLHETYDYPSFSWGCDSSLSDRTETVPIRYVARDSGAPLKVKAICLPFVLVKHPSRGSFAIDVRCYQLARLDRAYARKAWQALKPSEKKSKNRKGSKKSK